MPDKKEQLYSKLKEKGLYNKSFDEFKTQFSTPEKTNSLFQGLSKKGLYSKDESSFTDQFFPELKKKDLIVQDSKPIAKESTKPSATGQKIDVGGLLNNSSNLIPNVATNIPAPLTNKGADNFLQEKLSPSLDTSFNPQLGKDSFSQKPESKIGTPVQEAFLPNKPQEFNTPLTDVPLQGIGAPVMPSNPNIEQSQGIGGEQILDSKPIEQKQPEERDTLGEISKFLNFHHINKGFSDLALRPIDGGLKMVEDAVTSINEGLTGNKSAYKAEETPFGKLADFYDEKYKQDTEQDGAVDNAVKGTFLENVIGRKGYVSNVIGGIQGALPLIAATAITGGGALQLKAGMMLSDAVSAPLISNLTKTLAISGGLGSYSNAKKEGKGGLDALGETGKGFIGGGVSGLTIEAQMMFGKALGGDLTNYLIGKGISGGGKLTPAMMNALGVGAAFGGTSVGKDILNGKPIDSQAALHEFGIGFGFEVPGIKNALKGKVDNYRLNKEIVSSLVEKRTEARIKAFLRSDPEQVNMALSLPLSVENLQTQALQKGQIAFSEKDPQKKQSLHLAQLSLQNIADIKSMSELVIKDKNAFVDGLNKSNLPEEIKQLILDKVDSIHANHNSFEVEKKPIADRLLEIDSKLDELTTQATENMDNPAEVANFTAETQKLLEERNTLQTQIDKISEQKLLEPHKIVADEIKIEPQPDLPKTVKKLVDGKEVDVPVTDDRVNPTDVSKENTTITDLLSDVSNGKINSDDAAIKLDESGVEVSNEVYDQFREAESNFNKSKIGLQVGDTITVKGKNGNPDFKGNFRGITNEGKYVVVGENGYQSVYEKSDILESKATPKNEQAIIDTPIDTQTQDVKGEQKAEVVSGEKVDEVVETVNEIHLIVSSDAKSALESGRKKQVVVVDENGNPKVEEVSFTKEDAGLELDRLEALAQKGKLTGEQFQKSYFGQAIDLVSFKQATEAIKNDAVGFISKLRESFDGTTTEQSLPTQEVKTEDAKPTEIKPEKVDVPLETDTTEGGADKSGIKKEDVPKVKDYGHEDINQIESVTDLANMLYFEATTNSDMSEVENAIRDYGLKVDGESYKQTGDKNKVTKTMAKTFFKKGTGSLDTSAMEINNIYFNGEEIVKPQDLADFIENYPDGGNGYSSRAKAIREKLYDMTGKSYNKRTAQSLINAEKKTNSGERVNDEVISLINNNDLTLDNLDDFKPALDFLFDTKEESDNIYQSVKKYLEDGEQRKTDGGTNKGSGPGNEGTGLGGETGGGEPKPTEPTGGNGGSGAEGTKEYEGRLKEAESLVKEKEKEVALLQQEYDKASKALAKNLTENQTGMFENNTQSMFNDKDAQLKIAKKRKEKLDEAKLSLIEAKAEAQKVKDSKNQTEFDWDAFLNDDTPVDNRSLGDKIFDTSDVKPITDFIEGLKFKSEGGLPFVKILPLKEFYNGALDVIVAGIKAGNTLKNAVKLAVDYLKQSGVKDEEIRGFEKDIKGKFKVNKDLEETVKQTIKDNSDTRSKGKVIMSELDAIKKQFKDFEKGFKEGNKDGKKNQKEVDDKILQDLKDKTEEAFKEYDRFKTETFKTKYENLKNKYEAKLNELKDNLKNQKDLNQEKFEEYDRFQKEKQKAYDEQGDLMREKMLSAIQHIKALKLFNGNNISQNGMLSMIKGVLDAGNDPRKLDRAGDGIIKRLEIIDYDNKVSEAKADINYLSRSFFKGNQVTVSDFLKINPKDVTVFDFPDYKYIITDLKNHLKEGNGFEINDFNYVKDFTSKYQTPSKNIVNAEVNDLANYFDVSKPEKSFNKKFIDGLKKFNSHWLDYKNGMPSAIYQFKEKMMGNISADNYKALFEAKELTKLLSKYKSVKISDVDAALRGDIDTLNSLPDAVADSVARMRGHIDSISQEMIDKGLVKDSQMATMEVNLGKYLNRSFDIFDNKNWTLENLPEPLYNKAIQLLANQYYRDYKIKYPDLSEKELNEAVVNRSQAKVAEYFNKNENEFFNQKNDGSKDLSILLKRNEIPVELRELFGERKDPIHNYLNTIYKMASLAESSRFLHNVRESSLGKIMWEKDDLTRPKDADSQIATDGSESLSPLSGLYMTKELAEAFKDNDAKVSDFTKGYLKTIGLIKAGKTVGSVITHFKNVEGNIGFVLANGHLWNALSSKDGFNAAKIIGKEFFGKLTRDEMNDYILPLIKMGVIKQSVGANEIKTMFDPNKSSNDTFKRMLDKDRTVFQKGKSLVNRAGRKIVEAYQSEDDVFKIFAYATDIKRYSKALFGKDVKDLSVDEKGKLDNHVQEIVKNTYPTFSRVPRLARVGSMYVPLFGNFVSFQSEAIRNSYHIAKLALTELSSNNAELRKIGASRIAGITAYTAIKNGLLMYAGQAGVAGLMGVFADNKDEKQKHKDALRWVAPFSRNSDLIILPTKDNKFQYIDMSSYDPFGLHSGAINAAFNGKSADESLYNTMVEIASPFVDKEITAGMLLDLYANKDVFDRPIWNPEDDWNIKTLDIGTHIAKTIEPGTSSWARRLATGGDETGEVKALLYRTYKKDLPQQFGFKMKDYRERLDNVNLIYKKEYYAKDSTPESRKKTYDSANKKYKDILLEMNEDYQSGVRLGVKKQFFDTQLNDMRMPKKIKKVINADKNRLDNALKGVNIKDKESVIPKSRQK